MQNNIHYLGNKKIKKNDIKIEYTTEQIEEYIKCMNDPVYFAEKYTKIINIDEGLVSFHLRDYQKKMIEIINENRFTVCNIPRQSGKCICKNSYVKIRNKKNGKIEKVRIEDFYNMMKK